MMGFNFKKSLKIIPGVRLNVSKTGFSMSLGTKGAMVNLKRGRKSKVTVGLPGTGLSYSDHLGSDIPQLSTNQPAGSRTGISTLMKWVIGAFVAFAIIKMFVN
jgi:hypothetical protein